MPKIDISQSCRRASSSAYPRHVQAGRAQGREKTALGNAAGLTQFGVNLTRLKPGAASALRHWHENEDEFVYILEGEAGAGRGRRRDDPAGPAMRRLQGRRSERPPPGQPLDRDVLYLEIGTRAPGERAHYPDVDLRYRARRARQIAHPAQIRRAVLSAPLEENHNGQFQNRRGCRRHRARHLGHAGQVDERHRRLGHGRARVDIVEKVATDAAIKGAVVTSGKDTFGGGADLTMLERQRADYDSAAEAKGEEAADTMVFERSRKAVAGLSQARDLRQAVGRGDQRHRDGRLLRARARLPSPRRGRQSEDARSACPRSRSGCFPAPAARSASPRMMATADALQFLLKGDQIRLDRAKTMKLVDAVVPAADLVKAAKDWIKAGGKAKQPWDVDGFKLPGGPVWSKMGMMTCPAANALYRRRPTTTIRRRARSCSACTRACRCRSTPRCASSRATSPRSCARPKPPR